MKDNTIPENIRKRISEQARRAAKSLTHDQRVANGRKAWQTRIANMIKGAK